METLTISRVGDAFDPRLGVNVGNSVRRRHPIYIDGIVLPEEQWADLLEPASTTLVKKNTILDDASWVVQNASAQYGQPDVYGQNTAVTLTSTGAFKQSGNIRQTTNFVAGGSGTHCISFWLKSSTDYAGILVDIPGVSNFWIAYNLSSMTVARDESSNDTYPRPSGGIAEKRGDWYRCYLILQDSIDFEGSSVVIRAYCSDSAFIYECNNGRQLSVCYPQLEPGISPTTPIINIGNGNMNRAIDAMSVSNLYPGTSLTEFTHGFIFIPLSNSVAITSINPSFIGTYSTTVRASGNTGLTLVTRCYFAPPEPITIQRPISGPNNRNSFYNRQWASFFRTYKNNGDLVCAYVNGVKYTASAITPVYFIIPSPLQIQSASSQSPAGYLLHLFWNRQLSDAEVGTIYNSISITPP